MTDLSGKTAVVIGASGTQSFGVATAVRLASAGAKVVVSARRAEPLKELADKIGGLAITCDIANEADIKHLFESAREETGRVDIAVNCAGQLAGAPISMLTKELIQPTLDISFTGALLFFRYAAENMTEGGSIITISSLTARLPGPALAVYAGARAGIDYALRVAALEYGPQNIRFNSIAAGLIHTDMTAAMFQDEATQNRFIPEIPLRRMGSVEDVAESVLYFADERASGFVTGQLLDLSGGQHMGHLPG